MGSLMAMPNAKGLFHAAAVQSGSILRIAEPDQSAELARSFLAELGLAPGDLSKLQTASTKEITLPVQAGSRAGLRLVVFIQDPKSGHVLGVTEQKL